MEGKFKVTNSELNNSYQYENDSVLIDGSCQKNNETGALRSVGGTVYAKDADGNRGGYIGNFNGSPSGQEGGEVLYSLSQMSRRNSLLTWEAIEEIEACITGGEAADGATNDEEGGEA